GWRRAGSSTAVPSRVCVVMPARYPSVVTASRRGLATMLSPTHTASYPPWSANRAIVHPLSTGGRPDAPITTPRVGMRMPMRMSGDGATAPSPVEQVGGDEREDDRGVGLDDVARRRHVELAPRDLLIGDGPAVGAVRGGRVRDLTEVGPLANRRFEILFDEWDHADREIPGDAATVLQEAAGRASPGFLVRGDEVRHVLGAALHDPVGPHFALDDVGHEHVAERRVLPAGHPERKITFRGRHQPRIPRIDLVLARQDLAADQ